MIFLTKETKQFTKRWALLLTSFSALVVLLYGIISPSIALGVTTVTVRGNLNKVVPGPSLVAIANQPVIVQCGSVTKNATTNASGLYTVDFTEPGCAPYSAVSTKSTFNASILTRQVQASAEGRATVDLIF